MQKSPFSPVIRASEIASYVYSPELWWESRLNGVKVNEKIEKGLEFHESEAVKTIEAVKFFSLGKTLVFILIVLAAVVFALGLVLWIYTLF